MYNPRPFPGWTPQGTPAQFVWPLTATPMETGPMDIFALAKVTFGRESPLGTNTKSFKERFCEVRTYQVKVPSKWRKGKFQKVRIEKVKGFRDESARALVKELLTDRYIRHPYEIVEKFLPPIDVLPIWLEFGSRQAARYQELVDGNLVVDFVSLEANKLIDTKQVSYALQLFYQRRCCDGLTSLPNQEYRDSVKLDWTTNMLLNDLGAEKVIVFSQFHQPLRDLDTKLSFEGRPFVHINGLLDDYQNDESRIAFTSSTQPMTLLMTGKGSYALNLQAECNYGIAYNTMYNPKKLEQLYGRNRRAKPGHVGVYDDSHTVNWYHPLIKNTVEEAMWIILREREDDFREIFGNAEDYFSSLTPREQAEIIHFGQ